MGNLFLSAGEWTKKHSPEILLGAGLAGMFSALILVNKEAPKAEKEIEKRKKELNVDKLSIGETIKTVWKIYLPAAIITSASTASIIFSNNIKTKRTMALATACALSETAFKEYKDKVKETIGEKKEAEIEKRVAEDKALKDYIPLDTNIINTGKGTTLCFDALTSRYFYSDRNNIEKAINKLNQSLLSDYFISVNDYFDELGLPGADVGNILGWKIDDGFIDARYTSQLFEDSVPCLVIFFGTDSMPKNKYETIN